jgi:hypothetical protein
MGYYVDLMNSSAVIPVGKLDEALRVLKELNETRDDLKTGGSWSNGEKESSWFSWMPEDWSTFESAREVLVCAGFEECSSTDKGGLRIDGYHNKTGCERVLMAAIAHLVEPGSEMEWRGEEGEQYKWSFAENGMSEWSGEFIWTHCGAPIKL